MASIMTDLGDCFANTASIEFAKVLYTVAKLYYGADTELADEKINQMIELRGELKHVRVEKRQQGVEGEFSRISGIRYKSIMDNNNPNNHQINWNKITLNTHTLISWIDFDKVDFDEEIIDTEIQRKPEPEGEKMVEAETESAPEINQVIENSSTHQTRADERQVGHEPKTKKTNPLNLVLSGLGIVLLVVIFLVVKRRKKA